MPRIDLVEDWAVSMARQAVRDSLMSHGEEAVALAMYHPTIDDGTQPRCPVCFDDIYKQPDQLCNACYGTTFEGGVKYAKRVWALFSDQPVEETYRARGVWDADAREIQLEAFPLLVEHDYVVRVRKWSADHRPLELEGVYEVQQLVRNSLRTGNRFGQWTWDVVGQKANCTELQSGSIIYQYPVLNVAFPEFAPPPPEGAPPVVQPDSKVVYYPLPTVEEKAGMFAAQGFTFTQNTPSTIWTIPNPLGRYPAAVTVYIGEEIVQAEIDTPDIYTIIVTFSTPQAGRVEVI